MTNYLSPLEQKWASDQAALMQRVATLERLVTNLTSGPVAVTSSTHPASPVPGQQVLETDTGLTAQWNGAAWIYGRQKIAQKAVTATTAAVTLSVPTGPAFSTLRATWSARSDSGSNAVTYLHVQLNGDTTTRYVWEINQANANTPGAGVSPAANAFIKVGTMAAGLASSGYVGSGDFVIPNASGSTFKEITGCSSSMNALSNGYAGAYGGLWALAVQVSSITFFPEFGNFAPGSRIDLYGET